MFETGKYGVQELVNNTWRFIKESDDEDEIKKFLKDLYRMPKNKGKDISTIAQKYRPVKQVRKNDGFVTKLVWVNTVTGKVV